jgi:hypothetical protein
MYKAICIVGFVSIVMVACIRTNQGNQEIASGPAELQKICEKALGHLAKGENEQGFSLLRNHLVRSSPDDEWR